jgi:hypothetical protein
VKRRARTAINQPNMAIQRFDSIEFAAIPKAKTSACGTW